MESVLVPFGKKVTPVGQSMSTNLYLQFLEYKLMCAQTGMKPLWFADYRAWIYGLLVKPI